MKYITIVASALAVTLQGHAQTVQPKDTTLNRTVVVEQEYIPEVMDASKINMLPEVTPPAGTHSKVQYDETKHPASRMPAALMPSFSAEEMVGQPQPGIVQLGYGSLGALKAMAAYRFRLSKHDQLGLSLSSQGHKGTLDLPEACVIPQGVSEWNSHAYHTEAHMDYAHLFNSTELHVGGKLGVTNFALLPSGKFGRQRFTQGGLTLGLQSSEAYEGTVQYRSEVALEFFGRKNDALDTPLKETHLRVIGEAWAPISSKQTVSVGVKVNQYIYPKECYKSQTTVTLNPTFGYSDGAWNLRAGLFTDLAFGFGKKFQVAPDLSAEYSTGSHLLYAHVTGGRIANDFRRLEYLSPYTLLSDTQWDATYEQLNASIGWRGSPAADFKLHLYGGYQRLRNDLTPYLGNSILSSDTYPFRCQLIGVNTQNLYVGASADYSYRQLIGFHLSARYRNWKEIKQLENPLFQPELEMEARIDANPLRDLKLSVGYIHTSYTESLYKEASNLSVRGNYTLNEVWSGLDIWVEGHNLLNQSYMCYPAVPALGIQVMGGVSLRF